MKIMNALRLATVLGCAALLAGCNSNNAAGNGNQEAKRRAALARQQHAQPLDESQVNLLNAQDNNLDRDGNPMRGY